MMLGAKGILTPMIHGLLRIHALTILKHLIIKL